MIRPVLTVLILMLTPNPAFAGQCIAKDPDAALGQYIGQKVQREIIGALKTFYKDEKLRLEVAAPYHSGAKCPHIGYFSSLHTTIINVPGKYMIQGEVHYRVDGLEVIM